MLSIYLNPDTYDHDYNVIVACFVCDNIMHIVYASVHIS